MHEGLRLILTNEFAAAERLFAAAVQDLGARSVDLAAGEHDHRGAFAFVGSLAALLRGLATLDNNQLSDALERLRSADELISADSKWAGKTVLKGFCVLLMGIVQAMQGNLTRGAWHMLRSWLWLRNLEAEVLHYEGPEREFVRSTALLALGAFGLVVSLLPPYLTRTASWLSGTSGDRDEALGFLRRCWQEEGVVAPFAAIALVGFQVDVRTFLAEPSNDEALAEADQMLRWAEDRYAGSLFFEGLRANYLAVSRDVAAALELSDRMADIGEQLQALKLVIHYRRASYAQANLDWARAARALRDAIQVHVDVGRRSFVPFMAMEAAMCHELVGEGELRDEMVSLALEYRDNKDKTNWGAQDRTAFNLADAARAGTWDPELERFQSMTVKQRSTLFMSPANVEKFLGLLRNLKGRVGTDSRCRCCFLEAEVLRQNSQFSAAVKVCEEGLAMESSLSADCWKRGWLQFMHFVCAASHLCSGDLTRARESLRNLEQCPRDHDLYTSVTFKAAQLSRRLGVEMKDSYREVTVGARSQKQLTAHIPAGVGEVTWDFTLADFTINFVVAFELDGGGSCEELQRVDGHMATSGPVFGAFEAKAAGKLTLTFDNRFSLLRGKTVLCCFKPHGIELEEG